MSSLPVPPFPPSGRFIEHVRESSRALTQEEAVTVSVHISILIPDFCCCPVSRCHSTGTSFLCAWRTPPPPHAITMTPRLISLGRSRERYDMVYQFQPTTVFHVVGICLSVIG